VRDFLPYGRQYIDDEDISAVISVLKGDWLTQGPKIEEFERALAQYCGAGYAVVFNSGTAALHGAYFVSGLGDGDEFITSPNTFAATANAGLYLGARPVFVDIEKETGNIDVMAIERGITKRTKLIVPVHFAGLPAEMEKIFSLAEKYGMSVVEDACHALGSKYKKELTGKCRYSDMTVFSFHPVKHITTGEGGAVLTNRKDYYEKLLMFRTHGITRKNYISASHGDWYYEMHFLGCNYRMTDIQAALGISQLKKLDSFVNKRHLIAERYNEAFEGNPFFDIPPSEEGKFSSRHLYPIRLKERYRGKRKEIFSALRSRGIGVQVHYLPVYLHPYYHDLGYSEGLCHEAEDFYAREISIPLFPAMEDEDIEHVIRNLFETFRAVAGEKREQG
jgi:UDP-4-amino-4,6-dideoxy-N-acetyl-beta-L-altrosamine transaminase